VPQFLDQPYLRRTRTPATLISGKPEELCLLNTMLALALNTGRVMRVDETTGEVKWAVQAHLPGKYGESASPRVAMSPGDGRFMVSVGRCNAHWKLWDAASGAVHRMGARDGTGACICDDLIQRLSHAGCPVITHIGGICAVQFSPCGQRFATGGKDASVIVWDAETGLAQHRLQAEGACWSLAFSANGEMLACGTSGGSIFVWAATNGELLRSMRQLPNSFVVMVNFSPDSRSLASLAGGGGVSLWNVNSGEKIRSMEGCRLALFSPDGRTIATGGAGMERGVDLVDVESGAVLFHMVWRDEYVDAAAFSLDGSKLASGSHDGALRVWDCATGALIRTMDFGSRETTVSVVWGRDWVRDEKCAAFAGGHHPRLGAGSKVLELDVGVVRMILDRV